MPESKIIYCRCGCGVITRGREWYPGHDLRAIHDRIRNDFGGSISRFIDWYDVTIEVTN